jgi:hypothetical protein
MHVQEDRDKTTGVLQQAIIQRSHLKHLTGIGGSPDWSTGTWVRNPQPQGDLTKNPYREVVVSVITISL